MKNLNEIKKLHGELTEKYEKLTTPERVGSEYYGRSVEFVLCEMLSDLAKLIVELDTLAQNERGKNENSNKKN